MLFTTLAIFSLFTSHIFCWYPLFLTQTTMFYHHCFVHIILFSTMLPYFYRYSTDNLQDPTKIWSPLLSFPCPAQSNLFLRKDFRFSHLVFHKFYNNLHLSYLFLYGVNSLSTPYMMIHLRIPECLIYAGYSVNTWVILQWKNIGYNSYTCTHWSFPV